MAVLHIVTKNYLRILLVEWLRCAVSGTAPHEFAEAGDGLRSGYRRV